MPVPDFQSLMRPLMEAARPVGRETSVRELAPHIASKLGLTESDLAEMLPSQRQPTFINRLHWAKTFLDRALVVESTRRGYFRLTERGEALLAASNAPVSMKVLESYPEYVAWRRAEKSETESANSDPSKLSSLSFNPEEQIEQGFAALEAELKQTLLKRLQDCSPTFFERFVVDLLIAMGFGDGKAINASVLGKPGDGGIDGIVQQDELGLDAIYVQAKRYAPGNIVGRPDIQKFVGSMTGESASKGVFVTTSGFSQEARSFVEKVQQRIRLIDGERLAELALRHGVGFRQQQTFVIKSLDEDYFDSDIALPISANNS